MATLNFERPSEFAKRGEPGLSSPRVLTRYLREHRIPVGVAIRIGGRWFVDPDKLIEWARAGGSLAHPAEPEQPAAAGGAS